MLEFFAYSESWRRRRDLGKVVFVWKCDPWQAVRPLQQVKHQILVIMFMSATHYSRARVLSGGKVVVRLCNSARELAESDMRSRVSRNASTPPNLLLIRGCSVDLLFAKWELIHQSTHRTNCRILWISFLRDPTGWWVLCYEGIVLRSL